MAASGFEDKLVSRLGKLTLEQVRGVVERLLGQRSFLQTVFDHLQEGVLVTDEGLSIQFINRRARLMLGWPRGRDYVGENLAALVPEGHPLRGCIAALRGPERSVEGFECAYGPRLARTLSISSLPLRGQMLTERGEGGERLQGGEQDLLILLLNDVTERHKRQAEQARARRMASLATMTSGIAHEIKNPLNSINIHAQLLLSAVDEAERRGRGVDPGKARRAGHVILEETARLARIVEEFIQAARPRTPNLELHAVRGVLESAERIFRPECEQAGIKLELIIEHDLPLLLIDEHLLLQALRNLMRNAMDALVEKSREAAEKAKYAGEASGDGQGRSREAFEPRMVLEARLDGEHVNLVVADNGPGIADAALEHIFEPYYTTRFGGSGLGLMVVYRIVTEHHGALNVETQPGEGTRFTISLPLGQRPLRLLENKAGEIVKSEG